MKAKQKLKITQHYETQTKYYFN